MAGTASWTDVRQREGGMDARISNVLCVVCWLLVSSAHTLSAFPSDVDAGSRLLNPPDYSPSYNFVDEYLRNGYDDLNPSDSDLGDILWGILYQPNHPSLKRGNSGNIRNTKRQQGWHTDYGKRGDLYSILRGEVPQHRMSFTKRQQGWHTDYGKRSDSSMDLYSILRGQSAHKPTFTKRQQGWHTDYGKRSGFEKVYSILTEDPANQQPFSKRQQGWHINYGKRNGFDQLYDKPVTFDTIELDLEQLPREGQISDGPMAEDGDESLLDQTYPDETSRFIRSEKRQQAWHVNYGK